MAKKAKKDNVRETSEASPIKRDTVSTCFVIKSKTSIFIFLVIPFAFLVINDALDF
jgi:hypothetical protein